VCAIFLDYNPLTCRYGQTGAGKTFTMEGAPDPPELRGIIPNAFLHIFEKVALAKEGQQFLVRASYLEIYNEEVSEYIAYFMGWFESIFNPKNLYTCFPDSFSHPLILSHPLMYHLLYASHGV